MKKEKWYVYMLRCQDDSIYTGITKNVEKRYKQHMEGKGAKYTRSHKCKKIEVIFEEENKSNAAKLEYFLKQKSKIEKEKIIKSKK
ncbi:MULTISPECIES: GIY-YIG nuclease family protein [Fusobacterium]|uniref:GIY-YIG nuclease family protein n=1 Tax=Fusobacterium TaxID=848 RepID=UPI001476D95A|nr:MULTISPECIES: GIY-YIG nuclease family protein [Fusobacterium]NME36398.1 GIY-YIG nuclease family protein [Fusobacterium sp. FSA-380-WT-3A]